MISLRLMAAPSHVLKEFLFENWICHREQRAGNGTFSIVYRSEEFAAWRYCGCAEIGSGERRHLAQRKYFRRQMNTDKH